MKLIKHDHLIRIKRRTDKHTLAFNYYNDTDLFDKGDIAMNIYTYGWMLNTGFSLKSPICQFYNI